jgi:hypothetical protein
MWPLSIEISLVRNCLQVEKECGKNKFTIPKDEFPSLLR